MKTIYFKHLMHYFIDKSGIFFVIKEGKRKRVEYIMMLQSMNLKPQGLKYLHYTSFLIRSLSSFKGSSAKEAANLLEPL